MRVMLPASRITLATRRIFEDGRTGRLDRIEKRLGVIAA